MQEAILAKAFYEKHATALPQEFLVPFRPCLGDRVNVECLDGAVRQFVVLEVCYSAISAINGVPFPPLFVTLAEDKSADGLGRDAQEDPREFRSVNP